MRLIFLDILRFVVDIKDVGVDAAAFSSSVFGFRSCTEQNIPLWCVGNDNYSLRWCMISSTMRWCMISSTRQCNQWLLVFLLFCLGDKVSWTKTNIEWTMATANLHHSAPANLDHPLYPIYFIRSCTLPRPVTPGDAISAATLSVPPQHNLLFVTRVQGIEWWSLVTKR